MSKLPLLAIHPVQKVNCAKCKELLAKIYPNGVIVLPDKNPLRIICVKCTNEDIKKGQANKPKN